MSENYYSTPASTSTPRIDYYWREFHGIIPRDAVPAGNDRFGNPLYIGQGFVKNHGLIPGIIYPNRTFIVVPHTGPNKVERFIKILCSPNLSAFKWLRSNERDFFMDTIDRHVVKGGFEGDFLLHIGRISYQGEIVIGKVITSRPDRAVMWFIHNNQEKDANAYETLIYQNSK